MGQNRRRAESGERSYWLRRNMVTCRSWYFGVELTRLNAMLGRPAMYAEQVESNRSGTARRCADRVLLSVAVSARLASVHETHHDCLVTRRNGDYEIGW